MIAFISSLFEVGRVGELLLCVARRLLHQDRRLEELALETLLT
jgi:hypothetical protein